MFDYIVVGCGYAGAVCARLIAEQLDKKVLIIDRRSHIAGNMYDEFDEHEILVHRYGPHIPVMNSEKCFNFLSRFTTWTKYEHRVNAEIDGREIPLPFNLSGVDILFDKDKAELIKSKLIAEYGFNAQVPILDMMKNNDQVIKELADYVFEKVFLHYTTKMWGLRPEEIDPAVTARIPFRVSYDNRHFTHNIQVMPENGYTELFKNMLSHKNIEIKLCTEAKNLVELDFENKTITFEGKAYTGSLIYTGALDELLDYEDGALPYRSLKFEFQTHFADYIQSTPVLNWPDTRPATRRTEMKRLTQQIKKGVTTTITEYPGEYNKKSDVFSEPYYPIIKDEFIEIHKKYADKLKSIKNLYLVGRLADYKYYNMEAAILRAFDVFENEIK